MRSAFLLCVAGVAIHSAAALAQAIRHVASDPASGTSGAVLVDGGPLLHTAQLLPIDAAGNIVPGAAAAQLESVLARLDKLLAAAGSRADQVVKLNVYVTRDEWGDTVARTLAAKFKSEARPAVSLVVTPLPAKGALVAADAVAAIPDAAASDGPKRMPHAAILPAGSRIYVSGQAEPGTLREATRKTLESLTATLKHCGRSDGDVIQLKCFLQPMQSVADVQDEIARYYGADRTPPAVFVEWRMSGPIEIELIAWGGAAKIDVDEPLEFITPPGLKPSPLYSRAVRIHRGGTIYFGDLFGASSATAEQQAEQPFARLKNLLAMTGGDLKNLVKATYYVTDEEVSQAHNAIRPKYYDPQRPPAASKAVVAGTGRPGSRYAMDMIAVPSSRGTPASGPEQGFGLSAEDAAAGWISLFDGETTFGWQDAQVAGGLLRGGHTTARFGICQVRGQFAAAGTITVGGKEHAVGPEKPLAIDKTGAGGSIRMGEGVALKSLAVRPVDLAPLTNGRDLSGWKTIERTGPTDKPSAFWRAENGVLRAVGGPGAIEYDGGLFGDVVLQIDVRSRAVHSNGGVFIRSIPGDFMNGYEIQLHNRCLEDDPARTFRYATGGIDDRQDARRLVSRDFQTFRLTIIANGPHLASWVNGHQTADWTDDRPLHENPRQGQRLKAGALQLQAHDPATDFEVRQILAAPLN